MKNTFTTLAVLCFAMLKTLGVETNSIFEAIENDNVQDMQKLLLAKPDLEIRNQKGWTPLVSAVKGKRAEIVELLAKTGANVNASSTSGTPVNCFAAENGDTNSLGILLKYKADVDATNRTGISTLFVAAYEGHEAAVKLLVKSGAQLEKPIFAGDTVLMLIAKYGRLESAKILLRAGANVNGRGPRGHTALIYAAYNGNIEIAQLLLDAGADIDAKAWNKGLSRGHQPSRPIMAKRQP